VPTLNTLPLAIIMVSAVEMVSGIAVTSERDSVERAPGDFGFDPLGFGTNPKKLEELKLKEDKNGRLAKWAAAGLVLQGMTTSTGGIGNLGKTD
jgi:light-harvesting complex I chlorophyll a/b binding protein 1